MKKLIATVSIIALTIITANAQVQFGIKGGINLAKVIGSDVSNDYGGSNTKLGVNFGGLALIQLGPHDAIQGEANFSMKGVKARTLEYEYNYIDLLAAFRIMMKKHFNVFGGPQIAFLTSRPQRGPKYDSAFTRSSIKRTDFSVVAGLGWLSSSNIGIELKTETSLGTIDDTEPHHSYFNTIIAFNVYYLFGKKKGD